MSKDISSLLTNQDAIGTIRHLVNLSHQSVVRAADLIVHFPVEMLMEDSCSYENFIANRARKIEQIEAIIDTWANRNMNAQEQIAALSAVTADLFEIKSAADRVSRFYQQLRLAPASPSVARTS